MAKRMWLPAEIDDVMDQQLWNWAQWYSTPIGGAGAATSRGIEGKYRSSLDPDFKAEPIGYEAPSPWAPTVEAQEALRVHTVVMHAIFPTLERKFIFGYYVQKAKPEKLCGLCGIRWVEFNRFRGRVLVITRNRLTHAYPLIYKLNHNSHPLGSQERAQTRGSTALVACAQ